MSLIDFGSMLIAYIKSQLSCSFLNDNFKLSTQSQSFSNTIRSISDTHKQQQPKTEQVKEFPIHIHRQVSERFSELATVSSRFFYTLFIYIFRNMHCIDDAIKCGHNKRQIQSGYIQIGQCSQSKQLINFDLGLGIALGI